ncbi:class I SAM-dependent methyltransferase [Tsukamurella soli]|uniref:Class I SAM-dependent methyltransferase n=1 Tax=Tsukamurella soli TaxID=644556 RepID=A0ABP8JH19_9ACTN
MGAGTGIASEQLAAAGARVLAVEPDARMAELARSKGVTVEPATFEDWEPAGRRFDLVTFARSFHWVEPVAAVAKVASVLRPGGRIAILGNHAFPVAPSAAEFRRVHAEFRELQGGEQEARAWVESTRKILRDNGFDVDEREFDAPLHVDTDDWVNAEFTYSHNLTLPPEAQGRLRTALADLIGPDGVEARDRGFVQLGTLGR